MPIHCHYTQAIQHHKQRRGVETDPPEQGWARDRDVSRRLGLEIFVIVSVSSRSRDLRSRISSRSRPLRSRAHVLLSSFSYREARYD
jgi:hypothetical protein